MWCIIAATWMWDAAELLHKSNRRGDGSVHACLLLGALSLLAFNLFFEIPHFFQLQRVSKGPAFAALQLATAAVSLDDAPLAPASRAAPLHTPEEPQGVIPRLACSQPPVAPPPSRP